MKDSKGAISIEMIVTVIVLIILGGICIFMLTGENGIFVPRRDNEVVENSINNQNQLQEENSTNNQNQLQEENTINNENGALTVPVQ